VTALAHVYIHHVIHDTSFDFVDYLLGTVICQKQKRRKKKKKRKPNIIIIIYKFFFVDNFPHPPQ